jgi:hypothetical protein
MPCQRDLVRSSSHRAEGGRRACMVCIETSKLRPLGELRSGHTRESRETLAYAPGRRLAP